MSTTMVVVVRKGSPHARAKHLAQLVEAKWVYTGGLGPSHAPDTGYALQLFERHGLPSPPMGAVVNSTLSLLSLVGSGDYVGLLPRQIAEHPLAQPYVSIVPVQEEGLPLNIGAIAIRHFIAHLHRAAHQVRKSS